MINEEFDVIKVIGVGTCGSIIVGNMINDLIYGVDFIVANTDSQVLELSQAPTKILLTPNVMDGFANEEIAASVAGSDLVILIAGMGGATGSTASRLFANVSKSLGFTTIGIVTKPFSFEGIKRMARAEDGIFQLGKLIKSLIVLPNDQICTSPGNEIFGAFRSGNVIISCILSRIIEWLPQHSFAETDFTGIDWIADAKIELSRCCPVI